MNILKQEYEEYYNIVMKKNGINNHNFELVVSKDHSINLQIKKDDKEVFLHSSFSVENEANRWISNIDKEKDTYIIFGAGFFYHIKKLLEIMPRENKTFIIVEKNIDIFIAALENVDVAQCLKDLRVILIISDDPDEISQNIFHIMKRKGIKSLEICTLMSYQQLYKEWLEEVYTAIVQMVQLFGMNIATELYFSEEWMFNQFQNIKSFNIDSLPLESFLGEFENIPAIIVGAGPSLDKQLETLKKLNNKAIIFAAGSSINILEKNGITPHFEVAVDGGITEAKIIENIRNMKTILLFLSTVHHEAVKKYKGRKMWFRGNNYSVIDYFEKFVGSDSSRIELGPSCVNIAVDIAEKFGCYPIVLIGQDMAYTNKKLYAQGPDHNLSLEDEKRKKVLATDIYGNDVYTLNSFIGIKEFFDMYVRVNQLQDRIVNCTEGGLGINNVKNKEFIEVMNELEMINFDVNEYIDNLYIRNNEKTSNEMSKKTIDFIETIKKLIKGIEKESIERVNKVTDILNGFDDLSFVQIQECVKEVTELTEYIEENQLHKEAMKFSTAAYSLAIKNGIHKELESIKDLRSKYRLLLEGLQKEYVFYEQLLQTMNNSINY
ncbi:motility associated factor glycosyltransferase family protein [Oceanirhabdus sp. W0125-5]|uniref:motility associated factor glycosyltransferase family protein n=1 Tax=Oceanirhabdus sp. W0125-5 TaxID=2999116 RepID=UPI0022F2C3AB|nr:6-hydroxymethylpterin diphosphokinase MptE-like protein [Oceanirhabdus sp. W0125-5]WBW95462.1 DUF115 domain-containing protein [Oceanirhabdus sp. W0125-5]